MTTEPDPLDVYERRAIEAGELRAAAERKLAATPDHPKAQQIVRAAVLLDELRSAQSREACARHNVLAAEADLARWARDRRRALGWIVTVPLWGPCLTVAVLGVWSLSLMILLLGLVAFIVICAPPLRSSRLAREVARCAGDAADRVGMLGIDALRGVDRGATTRSRAARQAEHAAAVDAWEGAAVALLQAERGMPYTQVLPFAGLDEEQAQRIELGVAVIRGADRAATAEGA